MSSAVLRGGLRPASAPRSAKDVRILVVDGTSGAMRVVPSVALATLFDPGDLLVVNDAATLPASLHATTEGGEEVELRLVAHESDRRWTVALLGAGDHRIRTEDRPPPPRLAPGDRVRGRAELVGSVVRVHTSSARLLSIELSIAGRPDAPIAAIWSAIYLAGKAVQYAHVPEPLALWDVQNVYAGRPWAVEMPSAGRAFRVETLLDLRRGGIAVARVTHAAGLSSIGDEAIDALLPLPERFEVPEETWEAAARTRARGGRVVAIGTSAARALEGGARAERSSGITDLRIGPNTRRAVVDAVLTGIHDVETSHYQLLGAFAAPEVLRAALSRAEREGLLGHELGDGCLVWGQPREKLLVRGGQAVERPAASRAAGVGAPTAAVMA